MSAARVARPVSGRALLAARRRRRRLRWVLAVAAVVAGGVLAVVGAPLFEKTINEFTLPLDYQDIIRQQAAEKHLDPALIAAVIYAETKFDARTSPAGAEGLMQITPATAELLARRSGGITFKLSDLANPQVNIAYGSYYLRYLLDRYHGRLVEALAAYNGGMGNVDRWVAAARTAGRPFTSADIAFPETRDYVARVLAAQGDYRKTYATELGYR